MDDKEKIARKLSSMKKYVDFLRSKRELSLNELENNYIVRSAIERNFQLAIESVIEISEIIISREGFERPEDYKGTILCLGDHKIINDNFAKNFSKVAGLRNILVHMYEKVETEKLHEHLQNLEDFDKFARYVAKYLQKKRW